MKNKVIEVVKNLLSEEEFQIFINALNQGAIFTGNALGQILEHLITGADTLNKINDFDLFIPVSEEDIIANGWRYEDYRGHPYDTVPDQGRVHMGLPVYQGRVSLVKIYAYGVALQKYFTNTRMANWVDCWLSKDELYIGISFENFLEEKKLYLFEQTYSAYAIPRLVRKLAEGDYELGEMMLLLPVDTPDQVIEVGSLAPYLYPNISRAFPIFCTVPGVSRDDIRFIYERMGIFHPKIWVLLLNLLASEGREYVQENLENLQGIFRAIDICPHVSFKELAYATYFVAHHQFQVAKQVAGFSAWESLLEMYRVQNRYDALDFRIYSYNSKSILEVFPVPVEGRFLYGVEIELGYYKNSFWADCKEFYYQNHGKVLVTDDSTVNVEMITIPMPYGDMREFLRTVNLSKFGAHSNGGVHIHFSNLLPPLILGQLIVFINNPDNKEFIRCIADRLSDYALLKSSKKPGDDLLNSTDRMEAVNLTNRGRINKNTVEIRIFASTAKNPELVKYLEFVDALIAFYQSGKRSDAYQHFVAWVEADKYPILFEKVIRSFKDGQNL